MCVPVRRAPCICSCPHSHIRTSIERPNRLFISDSLSRGHAGRHLELRFQTTPACRPTQPACVICSVRVLFTGSPFLVYLARKTCEAVFRLTCLLPPPRGPVPSFPPREMNSHFLSGCGCRCCNISVPVCGYSFIYPLLLIGHLREL